MTIDFRRQPCVVRGDIRDTPATTPFVEHFAVEVLGLAAEVVEAEPLLETLQPLAAERLSQIGVGTEAEHRLGQCGHIAGETSSPVSPSSTTSGMPPAFDPMTGLPARIDSTYINPNDS